ncbi:HepT-like ribonuclease domain-containing protein [Rhizohabitans arisaemae]|uniref:HepT-like ribonuclease domain-containing protein n=1 Tax=Rhizohabitans arisaemae TaxID=2720610 RepID=UPI003D162280
MWQISIIGEAVGGISDETKASTPEIPWRLIRGLRNNVVHRYFDIDRIVHSAARVNVPELERQVLSALLQRTHPDLFERLRQERLGIA